MSLPLSSVVSVTVNLATQGITRQGFGIPLIFSNTGNAWATPELTRTYTSLAGLGADFASTTPEYQAAAVIFGQSPHPDTVMVGKGTHKPTKVMTLTVDTAIDSTHYIVNVYQDGVLQQVDVNSGAGSSVGSIATAIANAINALAAPAANFTAAAALGVVTCTADAAGNWFTLEPLSTTDQSAVSNLMTLVDTTTKPDVVADLDAILGESSVWYALAPLFNSKLIITTASTGIAAWCEANGRLLLVTSPDTTAATVTIGSASDCLKALAATGDSYSAGQYHPREYEWLQCATLGYFLPQSPGTDNWTNKVLTGPTPVNYTSTQLTNLGARRAGYFSTLGGKNIIAGGGKVASTTYGFIDVRRDLDWYTVNLQADLVDLEISSSKIANTDAGRRKIATVIAARNEDAIQQGVMSPDPLDPNNPDKASRILTPYTVYVPPVSDTGSFNNSTRALTGITTAWKLAGAIDSMAVTVNVSQ